MSQFSTPSSNNKASSYTEDQNKQIIERVHLKEIRWDCPGCITGCKGFLKVFGHYDENSKRVPDYVVCSKKQTDEGETPCQQKMIFSKINSICKYCIKPIKVSSFICLVPNSDRLWVHAKCLIDKPNLEELQSIPGPELCLRCGDEISKKDLQKAVAGTYKLNKGLLHANCAPNNNDNKRKFEDVV